MQFVQPPINAPNCLSVQLQAAYGSMTASLSEGIAPLGLSEGVKGRFGGQEGRSKTELRGTDIGSIWAYLFARDSRKISSKMHQSWHVFIFTMAPRQYMNLS